MVFNSVVFVLFYIIFYLVYWLLNNRFHVRYRNIFILVASYFFYGWWDWRFLSLIFISSLIDFGLGLFIFKANNRRYKRALLLTSVFTNLGILGVFKYYNFFVDSLASFLTLFSISVNYPVLNIILPVGISFYTFQTLSYTIDIYYEKLKPTKDAIAFFAFISFFPQLVAGPIERAKNLLHQFFEKKTFQYQNAVTGLRLILWGYFKKIVIADNVGMLVDQLFNSPAEQNLYLTTTALFLFAIQIYCDFSGYSDIAIGLARTLGFELMINFKTPYFSKSLSEFWHRWHISLSTWFRDYVYIPLGGNQGKHYQIYLNIFITFLLSGLWHGAKINFLIWGALHGLLLVFEKAFSFKPRSSFFIPVVFLLTMFLWLPFRASSIGQLTDLIHSLTVTYGTLSSVFSVITSVHTPVKTFILIITVILFILTEYRMNHLDFSLWINKKKGFFRYAFYYSLLIGILLLGNFNLKPYFIYFQF